MTGPNRPGSTPGPKRPNLSWTEMSWNVPIHARLCLVREIALHFYFQKHLLNQRFLFFFHMYCMYVVSVIEVALLSIIISVPLASLHNAALSFKPRVKMQDVTCDFSAQTEFEAWLTTRTLKWIFLCHSVCCDLRLALMPAFLHRQSRTHFCHNERRAWNLIFWHCSSQSLLYWWKICGMTLSGREHPWVMSAHGSGTGTPSFPKWGRAGSEASLSCRSEDLALKPNISLDFSDNVWATVA